MSIIGYTKTGADSAFVHRAVLAADGVTDDATALNAALTAGAGGTVILPAGTIAVGAEIQVPDLTRLVGQGKRQTIIKRLASKGSMTAVVCSTAWYSNQTTSGDAVYISDLTVDGNKAGTGNSGTDDACPGIVIFNEKSVVSNVYTTNTAGHGIKNSVVNRGGTAMSDTANEFYAINCMSEFADGVGILADDAGNNALTDGFVVNCVVRQPLKDGIKVTNMAGWLVQGNHVYSGNSRGTNAYNLTSCYDARIIGNYVDGGCATTTNGTYHGMFIGLSTLNKGVVVSGNVLNCKSAPSGSTLHGITITAPSSGNCSPLSTYGNHIACDDSPTGGTIGTALRVTGAPDTLEWRGFSSTTIRGGWAANTDTNGRAWLKRPDLNPFKPVTGIATIPRSDVNSAGSSTLSTGTLRLTFFTPDEDVLISQIRVISGTTAAAATPTLVRFGLYSEALNGDLTLVASTASDTSLLAGTNTRYTKAISSPSTYQMKAGQRYAFGAIVVTGAAAPTVLSRSTVVVSAEQFDVPYMTAQVAGQTDLPSPITQATLAASTASMYAVLLP